MKSVKGEEEKKVYWLILPQIEREKRKRVGVTWHRYLAICCTDVIHRKIKVNSRKYYEPSYKQICNNSKKGI